MSKQARSDDYIDGLQAAYILVNKRMERAVISDYKRAYQCVLVDLNEAIENASVDKPRIIIP